MHKKTDNDLREMCRKDRKYEFKDFGCEQRYHRVQENKNDYHRVLSLIEKEGKTGVPLPNKEGYPLGLRRETGCGDRRHTP